jgi:hypothetical protein
MDKPSQRAVELLAAEYERARQPEAAQVIRVCTDKLDWDDRAALRAIDAALSERTLETGEAGTAREIAGLELTEDGLSLRTPYDGDVDGDGRHVVVGGEIIATFEDSDLGERVRDFLIEAARSASTTIAPSTAQADVREAVARIREAVNQREAGFQRDLTRHRFGDYKPDRSNAMLRDIGLVDLEAVLTVAEVALASSTADGWRPTESCPMWQVAIVTDGERAAVAQRAENDFGMPYWAIDPEDGLEWEPTLWSPIPQERTGE